MCVNPRWFSICAGPGNATCGGAGSTNEGCEQVGDYCNDCYRGFGELEKSDSDGGAIFGIGAVVYRPDYLAAYGIDLGDVITHFNGKRLVGKRAMLALARAKKPYILQVSRPGVGYFEVVVE
jgi:hypothetical protein